MRGYQRNALPAVSGLGIVDQGFDDGVAEQHGVGLELQIEGEIEDRASGELVDALLETQRNQSSEGARGVMRPGLQREQFRIQQMAVQAAAHWGGRRDCGLVSASAPG